MYINVYRNCIYNLLALKTTEMSFSGCIGKETVVCPCNAILRNDRKERIIDTCDSVHEFLINFAKWKSQIQKI